ncbi:MAG: DNA gyrase inhibitor YacG [Hyphomicrobiaceae bacterium]|nr:DNA gyrase inhibitor YacG [Hyphomicrobiaceae bacterium]
MCHRPTETAFRPFCSKRCADVDLSKWLSGVYAIPGDVDSDEDGTASGDAEAAAAGRSGTATDDGRD